MDDPTADLPAPSLDDLKTVERLLRIAGAETTAALLQQPEVSPIFQRKWLPNPGQQAVAYDSPADDLFYGGQAGGGKAIDINELVPVPHTPGEAGFKRNGDILVGDFVMSPSGGPVEVTAVSPIEVAAESYEVVFDTGEVIKADGNHLWRTWTEDERDRLTKSSDEWRAHRRKHRASRAVAVSKKPWVTKYLTDRNKARVYDIEPPVGGIRTTREIALTVKSKRGAINHSVAVAKPLFLPEQDLPIEPYLFGLWLGDGWSAAPVIGMLADDWAQMTVPVPDRIRLDTRPPRKRAFEMRSYFALRPALKVLGIFGSGRKRIPPLYLRASQAQRAALLQGICDTDGSCDTRGQIEVGSSNAALAGDLQELVSSLGIKATLRRKRAKAQNGNGADHFRLKFVTAVPCFRLKRKADRQKLAEFRNTTQRRYIIAVRRIAPIPMRCIRVAHSDGMYLVGRSMIATHNSSLIVGLSLTKHSRSLVLRRTNVEATKLVGEYENLLGSRVGWNGQDDVWRIDGRIIDIRGCQFEADKQKFKGTPRDLCAFDEIGDFSETMFRFIKAWNRSSDPNQRCRVVCTGNPPTTPEGLWVLKYWGAWLDPTHPHPAQFGELRWYTTIEDEDTEVDGRGPHKIPGEREPVLARSRTFIPAALSDNPYLAEGGQYASVLAALPAELRSAYRDGNFQAAIKDDAFQCIPTHWIDKAQARWEAHGFRHEPMTALALDPAGGGRDSAELAYRHGGWYGPLDSSTGKQTADGSFMAAMVVTRRKAGAPVILDVGGGYSGAVSTRLGDNEIPFTRFDGRTTENLGRTKGGNLKFANRRAEAWWRFREALDPDQDEKDLIALPPDSELKADLAAPRWTLTGRGILLEDKLDIRSRLGRSPGKGDAVVMCWSPGGAAAMKRIAQGGGGGGMGRFKVLLGYAKAKGRG